MGVNDNDIICFIKVKTFFCNFSVGAIIGKYPWSTILLSLLLFISMTCGLYFFNVSTNDEFLWTPYGSDVSYC